MGTRVHGRGFLVSIGVLDRGRIIVASEHYWLRGIVDEAEVLLAGGRFRV